MISWVNDDPRAFRNFQCCVKPSAMIRCGNRRIGRPPCRPARAESIESWRSRSHCSPHRRDRRGSQHAFACAFTHRRESLTSGRRSVFTRPRGWHGTPRLGAIVAGSALAIFGAWLASTLMPIGLARQADPSPGRQFDVVLLLGGAAALIAVLSSMALLVAWRHARRARDRISVRRSVVGRVFEVVSLTPSLGVGLRAALRAAARSRLDPGAPTLVRGDRRRARRRVTVHVRSEPRSSLEHTRLFGVGWDVAVADTRAERPDSDRPCTACSERGSTMSPARSSRRDLQSDRRGRGPSDQRLRLHVNARSIGSHLLVAARRKRRTRLLWDATRSTREARHRHQR